MTEQEKEDIKKIIEVTLNSFVDTMFLNIRFDKELKDWLNELREKEIKWGKDDVDRLDPKYWEERIEPNTFYVEWNGHHPS